LNIQRIRLDMNNNTTPHLPAAASPQCPVGSLPSGRRSGSAAAYCLSSPVEGATWEVLMRVDPQFPKIYTKWLKTILGQSC